MLKLVTVFLWLAPGTDAPTWRKPLLRHGCQHDLGEVVEVDLAGICDTCGDEDLLADRLLGYEGTRGGGRETQPPGLACSTP